MVSTVSIAHAFILPQETRCLLIDFYDSENEENLYYRKNISPTTKAQLQTFIAQAEEKVGEFWEEKQTNPKFIYCETEEDYLKFGLPFMTPAVAILKFKSYIIISKSGID